MSQSNKLSGKELLSWLKNNAVIEQLTQILLSKDVLQWSEVVFI